MYLKNKILITKKNLIYMIKIFLSKRIFISELVLNIENSRFLRNIKVN